MSSRTYCCFLLVFCLLMGCAEGGGGDDPGGFGDLPMAGAEGPPMDPHPPQDQEPENDPALVDPGPDPSVPDDPDVGDEVDPMPVDPPPPGGGEAGTGGQAGTGGNEPSGSGDDLPMGAHCAPVAQWDATWVAWEEEVLELTNQRRAMGANCGQYGSRAPVGPLTMNPQLRCAARLHSMDMGVNGYFDHAGRDGSNPTQRISRAGYAGVVTGENIAKGQQSPREVVNGWMNSDGHCVNIMNGQFTEIGVGYWQGQGSSSFFNNNRLWTQKFGRPGTGGRDNCIWPGVLC